ncbi:MAG: DUF6538 domain-containing protein, partial [Burkholderiaceae bacterium]
NGIWHYQRRRPMEYIDIDPRSLIRFSLRTRDFSEAKLKAAQISLDLESEWIDAKSRGVSLKSRDLAERYGAAASVQTFFGFAPKPAAMIPDEELLDRLRALLQHEPPAAERKALLGLVVQPGLSMADAFERF